ncbi:MAG: hypothetical protein F6K49_16890 [Moorea sp. SIO3I6]|nr:hypothetical protein [Moorena sp. SIO4A5]NEP23611.1 hypothetical protein [Moorena sp. SIO3I6]
MQSRMGEIPFGLTGSPVPLLHRYLINSCLLPLPSCLSQAGVCSQFK